STTVHEILRKGEALELKGHWEEALGLYERARKENKQSKEIANKAINARTHFEIQRRYADPAFIRTLNSTPHLTAHNILSEVFLKVDAYYVGQPEWVAMVRQGLSNIDVALYDPSFQKLFLAQQTEPEINYAYQRMHQIAQQFRVGSRKQAIEFALAISNSLSTDLQIPKQITLFEFINGATTALDPYSTYLTGEQYADVMSQIDGNFVGLGVEIFPKRKTLQIASVIPNGPAAIQGLKKGDFILRIDGKSVDQVGGDAAADMLKGREGTMASLEIQRTIQGNNQTFSMQITRARVDIPSVQGVSIIDQQHGIGYIQLTNFQKTTVTDFQEALWSLHKQGLKSLIVDVRGNPGGLLTASVNVADLFVSQGILVSTKGRNSREDYVHRAQDQGTWKFLPLTVLVDRDSASASEIFAGAISDQQRGTIVGETSYGKGSVQGIFPLTLARGGIRLTTAKFYSPSGAAISNRGVKPDIIVQTTQRPTFDLITPDRRSAEAPSADKALETAISVARRKSQQRNAG
ncbi:MAG: S41 family peptidase, partial [Planctomycetota bacterium]|nr:S41 family peptidase [Planctomycetota bacterium]